MFLSPLCWWFIVTQATKRHLFVASHCGHDLITASTPGSWPLSLFFFIKHDDWHFWYQFTVSPFSSEWLRGSYITVILQSSKLAKICRIGRKIRSKDLPFFLLVVRSKNYLLWMKSWNLAVPNPAIDSLLGQCICRWRKHGHMTSSQITSLGFWTELYKGPD